MKNILVVAYGLRNPSQNAQAIRRRIKASGDWNNIGDCAYLVSTDHSPVQVRDRLAKAMQDGDRLYVGIAANPSAWLGMSDQAEMWIHSRQHGRE